MNTNRKPRDDEIDVFGLSHQGKVRKQNQDHFMLASIHKTVRVHASSLTPAHLQFADERLAFVAMVADGVGGGEAGEEASTTTVEVATQYLASSTNCYFQSDSSESVFIDSLQEAALKAHEQVRSRAQSVEGKVKGMATTLTLFMGVWPWYYILQVGDSRYYLYRDDSLTQLTRDQTVAQELVDKGILTRAAAQRSQLSHVLSSAIGGEEALPVVTRLKSDWGNIHLLCSDGLTKHVSEERIAQRLREMTSAKEVCEQLLQDALDDGGSDNVTIIVGRTVERRAANRVSGQVNRVSGSVPSMQEPPPRRTSGATATQ